MTSNSRDTSLLTRAVAIQKENWREGMEPRIFSEIIKLSFAKKMAYIVKLIMVTLSFILDFNKMWFSPHTHKRRMRKSTS